MLLRLVSTYFHTVISRKDLWREYGNTCFIYIDRGMTPGETCVCVAAFTVLT